MTVPVQTSLEKTGPLPPALLESQSDSSGDNMHELATAGRALTVFCSPYVFKSVLISIRKGPGKRGKYSVVGNGNSDNASETLDKNEKTKGVELERNVGLFSGTAFIVGTMIGSGIFISPKGVLEFSGSVGMSLIVWVACGIVSIFGALCYAELGTLIPISGGEHAYYMYAYGKRDKMFGPIPAFLYDWVGLFIIRPTMFALISLSMGTYAVKPFFPDCEMDDSLVKLITVLGILLMLFINGFSVKLAARIQVFCTVSKLLAIAILAFGGIYKIIAGNDETIREGFQGTEEDVGLIATAFYNGLWAYDSWNNLNYVTEEIVNPSRNLPLAIMIGIPLTTLSYALTNVGYFGVMSRSEILVSHAVAVTWGDRMLGVMSWIMPVFVSISCFGAANGCLFSSGRLSFAAARDGHFPEVFSYLSYTRKTPLPSIILMAFIGVCLLIPGDISTLMDFYSFSAWLIYGFSAFTVLFLRFKEPKSERLYKVPLFIPILTVIISAYLVLAPIIREPKVQFIYAVMFILSGLLIYFPLIYGKSFQRKLQPYTKKFTILVQKLTLAAPPKKADF
ncbi:hypothetical protein FSP39_002815 [Pinctada imbricata]|uniref:b(0,+)-type amino acid transporter 1 n=1 Tax=Pinctada imbricata TaxID=66713 RepID=A0AA88YAH0_PINIB|nr:hypothetical protein FSP39_002815 [Pinctada imbricata]